MNRGLILACLFGGWLGASASAAAQPGYPTAIPQTKFDSGQDIQPYFEGWIKNKDGTFDMVFGYFNRNWREELAVPAGPLNSVEPGGPDRGQPTYFLPRRQGWVYRVRVPANFGQQTVTWTITANGKTNNKAYGELLRVEEITERIIMTRANLNPGDDDPNQPPVINVPPVAGAAAGAPIAVTAMVTDDGLPEPRAPVQRTVTDATRIQAQANSSAPQRPRGLTVSWMQLGGSAKVTFDKTGAIAVSEGKAIAMATFPQPGTYLLRATANDGALATRADLSVVVAATPGATPGSTGPIIENDRVTVWDVTAADPNAPQPAHESVWVSVVRPGDVQVKAQGARGDVVGLGGRAVVIDLKDKRVAPIANRSGHPLAFPRPGQLKKVFEDERVIVWDYTWTPGQPTPMHFHDKDVVVVYLADGALTSTTPDGQHSANEFSVGTVRFNQRDRVHTEVLSRGAGRAVITELK